MNSALLYVYFMLTEEILKLLSGQEIQYLDIPSYMNLGDHLIAHGTFTFFEKHHIKLIHSGELKYYPKEWLEESKCFVFQGGGNWGDLYPFIHNSRKSIIKHIKHKRIIVLPQSIFYSKEKSFLEDVEFFKGCTDFHLFTRDKESFHTTRKLTKNAYLVPDMAHQLKDKLSRIASHFEDCEKETELFFLRKDNEIKGGKNSMRSHVNAIDWDYFTAPRKRHFDNLIKLRRFFIKHPLTRQFLDPGFQSWQTNSWQMLEPAIRLICRHDRIITDRLHVMLLAQMLNKNVTVLDNNLYGKLLNYYSTWSELLPNVTFADKTDCSVAVNENK